MVAWLLCVLHNIMYIEIALDLKRHEFSVELEADSQEEALEIFKKQRIERLDISDAPVSISVKVD